MQRISMSQQGINLLRQILNAEGWAKTIDDIYIGGKLLDQVIPELDDLSWVKTPAQLAALSESDREAYLAADKAWVSTIKEFDMTAKQVAATKRAFETLTSTGKLGPNRHLSEIIETFGLAPKDE